ncbi:MAG: membrane protein insertion efficiency factor YidD [Candidatus Komeilibacteria bacterium RIFCSPLOWO2_01_FULL_45_10]|uniref:Putative membrane protein insertion efficiency factor n=1 Tax=Candidatus Komeilibacteria bacterium RIFCSPLOWO2_01_FULL_45_10 TaxID=1798550 RepID=A0A1G2BLN9_9BACT|nr:MAG: membrane protein insertion efficiency factor YidD [Candidatus Komeilibacteria bacterium RIFCSPLOWO2_01_FULL_45_10]
MKTAVLKVIRLYQRTLSLDSGWFSYRHPHGYCRFYPRCSEYCYQAIAKHGILKGSALGLRRILKCHPFNKGGEDKI